MAKFSKAHRLALSKAAKARYGKKRGVKPGTKRGKYKRNKIIRGLKQAVDFAHDIDAQLAVNKLRSEAIKTYAPNPVLTLCGQLEDSILLLEQRISNAIAKINSLMG